MPGRQCINALVAEGRSVPRVFGLRWVYVRHAGIREQAY